MTTKPNLFRVLFVLFLGFIFFSCQKDEANVEPEVFDEASKPFFEHDADDDSYSLQAWNCKSDANCEREYPLLVYLHGRGYNGTPPSFVGYQNDEFKRTYPSFVYMPHSDGQYNVDVLIKKIKKVIEQNRIDKSRVYIIGYSMGAYWSAPLANKLADEDVFFAGIVSQAGLSNNSNYKSEVLDKTSIWIHLGDQDSNYNHSQERFSLIKDYCLSKGASSEVEEISISGSSEYLGTSETLQLNGIELVKNTVYTGVGHGISHFPFQNPDVMKWLYTQDTDKR